MAKRSSLAELAGSHVAGSGGRLQLSKIHEILGEATPDLPPNQVGRHRLVRALLQRFGPNWRSIGAVGDLVKQFDAKIELEVAMAKMRAIKVHSHQTKGKK